jgi:hypothetical protein
MQITLHETNLKSRKLDISGDSDLHQTCEAYRAKANLPPSITISIERSDDQPFWVEDMADYTVETRYDPDLDTRYSCRIRIDARKEARTFILENCRCSENDPAAIWRELVSKSGFVNTQVTQMSIHGTPKDGIIRYQFKHATSLERVTFPALIARFFTIFLNDDDVPWESSEPMSPASQEKSEVWEQLNLEHSLPHWSQFTLADQDHHEIPHLAKHLPPGEILAVRVKFPVTRIIE